MLLPPPEGPTRASDLAVEETLFFEPLLSVLFLVFWLTLTGILYFLLWFFILGVYLTWSDDEAQRLGDEVRGSRWVGEGDVRRFHSAFDVLQVRSWKRKQIETDRLLAPLQLLLIIPGIDELIQPAARVRRSGHVVERRRHHDDGPARLADRHLTNCSINSPNFRRWSEKIVSFRCNLGGEELIHRDDAAVDHVRADHWEN